MSNDTSSKESISPDTLSPTELFIKKVLAGEVDQELKSTLKKNLRYESAAANTRKKSKALRKRREYSMQRSIRARESPEALYKYLHDLWLNNRKLGLTPASWSLTVDDLRYMYWETTVKLKRGRRKVPVPLYTLGNELQMYRIDKSRGFEITNLRIIGRGKRPRDWDKQDSARIRNVVGSKYRHAGKVFFDGSLPKYMKNYQGNPCSPCE